MIEKESSKELQKQFPKVKLETIKKLELLSDDFDKFLDDSCGLVRRKDPNLWEILEWLSEEPVTGSERSGFFYGAFFVFRALDVEGIEIPPLSIDTIDGFFAEIEKVGPLFEEPPKFRSFKEIYSFKEKLKTLEFSQPDPLNRAEENPFLMVYIVEEEAGYGDYFRAGALTVYELKRRQFFADQLAKQFGG